MNKNKIKTFLEIIYNCPVLLLVLITSLVILPFSDEINILGIDKTVAAACFQREDKQTREEKNNDLNEIVEPDMDKLNTDQEETDRQIVEKDKNPQTNQNAGIRKDENDDIEKDSNQKNDIEGMEDTGKWGKNAHGTTEFVKYDPISTDSRYYSDAGKVALTTTYDYVMENESYFNDAAFLGDSRTLGISDYAGLDGADFYCDNGMTIYKILEDNGVTYQKTGEKVDMKEVLQEKQYGKIYIMLGMNELGYGNTPMYLKQYLKVIRQIKEWQPGVIIYVMGNLHVSREKNNMETEFNNININDKNVASARLANGRDVFYLDCNPLFTDEEGYLQEELTFDGVHLYAQHYDKWREFLFSHGVERGDEEKKTATAQGGNGDGGSAAE